MESHRAIRSELLQPLFDQFMLTRDDILEDSKHSARELGNVAVGASLVEAGQVLMQRGQELLTKGGMALESSDQGW